MISVLGLELNKARELLTAAGYDVTEAETRSRKGVDGSEARVVRERFSGKQAELVWAVFKTDAE